MSGFLRVRQSPTMQTRVFINFYFQFLRSRNDTNTPVVLKVAKTGLFYTNQFVSFRWMKEEKVLTWWLTFLQILH